MDLSYMRLRAKSMRPAVTGNSQYILGCGTRKTICDCSYKRLLQLYILYGVGWNLAINWKFLNCKYSCNENVVPGLFYAFCVQNYLVFNCLCSTTESSIASVFSPLLAFRSFSFTIKTNDRLSSFVTMAFFREMDLSHVSRRVMSLILFQAYQISALIRLHCGTICLGPKDTTL